MQAVKQERLPILEATHFNECIFRYTAANLCITSDATLFFIYSD